MKLGSHEVDGRLTEFLLFSRYIRVIIGCSSDLVLSCGIFIVVDGWLAAGSVVFQRRTDV